MDLEKLRPTLSEIREKLRTLHGPVTEKEFLECDTIQGGVPKGVLCEIIGSARTEWILNFMKQNLALNTFWAEQTLSLHPPAVQQRGIPLSQIFMAETGDKLFHALRKAMKSKLFNCVVLPGVIEEVKMLKALQLFARESNACVFLLSKNPRNVWSVPFQVEVNWLSERESQMELRILKSKFTQDKKTG